MLIHCIHCQNNSPAAISQRRVHGHAISLLPEQIDMSLLDYIDRTSGAKWGRPLDTLPNLLFSPEAFITSVFLQ